MKTPPADLIIDTSSTDQTVAAGAAIGRVCQASDIIALEGELGAGKTQLVRGLAQGMGLNPRQVSSPTFVIVQEYEPPVADNDKPILVHIDAYRIKSEEDLASIGWYGHGEELRDQAVVAVEWASLIAPALGEDVLHVGITHEPHGRRITIGATGRWRSKLDELNQAVRDAELDLVPQQAKP